jgi:hypothetical protein
MTSSPSRLRNLLMATVAIGLIGAGTSDAQTPAKQVTFTRDVAPIFQEKCEACHRPDSIAPMSLRTFEEARPWARSIRSRVESRQMPPWHIDRTVGIQKFKNDRSLSDAQLATVVAWVDQGAVMGDPKDMPPAIKWPEGQGWNYAARFGQTEPDLVIRNQPWTMKMGEGNTWFKRVVETGVTEPRWVRAIEVRPGSVKGRKIVHHANIEIDQLEPDGSRTAGRFMEWAVGKEGELMRSDTGRLIMPMSRVSFDVHYASTNEDVTDAVELGLYFYRPLLLPERVRSQIPTESAERRQLRRGPRDSAELDRLASGVLHPAEGGAD